MKDISPYYRLSLKRTTDGTPVYAITLDILKGLPFYRKATISMLTLRESLAVIERVHAYIARLCSDYYLFDGVIEFADRVLGKALNDIY